MDVATLEREALKLDELSRLQLVDSIERSLKRSDGDGIDDAFFAVLERRNREMDEDPSIGLSHEEVMSHLRAKLK